MSMVSARPSGAHDRSAPPARRRADGASTPFAARLSRPSLRDRRLVLGLVLVLGSTVLGARLLGQGAPGAPVWVARHDLAAGVPLRGSDLTAQVVDVGSSGGRYLSAEAPLPADVVLAHPVSGGELLPAAAVVPDRWSGSRRTVTLPVEQFHAASDLERGDAVDVYLAPTSGGTAPATAPVLLAAGVVVVDVEDAGDRFGGAGATRGVAVSVDQQQVAEVVGGVGRGGIELVRVPVAGR